MTCFFNFEIYYLSISTFQTKKGQCSTVMTLTPNIWSVFYHHTHLLNDPGHFNKSGVCMCVCGGGEEWGGERGERGLSVQTCEFFPSGVDPISKRVLCHRPPAS